MLLLIRIVGFVVGSLLALANAPWTGLFILGLIMAGIFGFSFLPDLIDAIDF